MIESTTTVIYLLVYVIAMIYFAMLGSYLLAQRGNDVSTHGELETKLRMTRTIGGAMLVMVLEWFIYLPPMLMGCLTEHFIYNLIFIVELMISTPTVYIVMFAIAQRRVSTMQWAGSLAAPFLLLAIWQATDTDSLTPTYTAAALGMISLAFLFLRFRSEYRIYMQRIQSEYSELSDRGIFWSRLYFYGFAVQLTLFVVFSLMWTPVVEILYAILTIINTSCLCVFTCRQRTIDLDVVDDIDMENEALAGASVDREVEEKAFYGVIEQKLKLLCEDESLFLEPDLTRDKLCQHLSISSTYLKAYFRNRGLTFYQYVNTLRAEYAYNLMREKPDMPISRIAEQSGFRSQTTFRKVFQEMRGCLPSEVDRL